MNGGAFGENFPYSNFHDLNMDWIIKIAKDFLDQYTNIQNTITEGLEELDSKAQELEALLQEWYDTHSEDIANQLASALSDLNEWYDTHSEDIANQLASALSDLNEWYTQHEGYLNQYLSDSIQTFNTSAEQKTAQLIASIPADYTSLSNDVNELQNEVSEINTSLGKTEPSNNLLNPSGFVEGYYSNGVWTESETYLTSNYMNVEDAENLYIHRFNLNNGQIEDGTRYLQYIYWFDANRTYTTRTEIIAGTTSYTVPSGTKYARVMGTAEIITDQFSRNKGLYVGVTDTATWIAYDDGNIPNYAEIIDEIQTDVDELQNDVSDINTSLGKTEPSNNLLNPSGFVEGYYASGVWTESETYLTSDYMNVEDAENLYIHRFHITDGQIEDTTRYLQYIYWFDANRTYTTRTEIIAGTTSYAVPAGAKYARVMGTATIIADQFSRNRGLYVGVVDTTTWVEYDAGGIPNYVEIIDEIKTDIDDIKTSLGATEPSNNLLNPSGFVEGYYSNGVWTESATYLTSDYINVEDAENLYVHRFNLNNGQAEDTTRYLQYIYWFDANKTYTTRTEIIAKTTSYTVPPGNKYARIMGTATIIADQFSRNKGLYIGVVDTTTWIEYDNGGVPNYVEIINEIKKALNNTTVSLLNGIFTIKTNHAQYIIQRIEDPSKNLDTYRLYKGDLKKDNGLFNMWTGSDAEGAIKIVGETDFVSGYHGSEIMTSFKVFKDGIDITSETALTDIPFNTLMFYIESDVYHCYQDSAVASNIAFKRARIIKFVEDKVIISNSYIAQENLEVLSARIALFQCYKNDGNTPVFTNYSVNSDFKNYSVANITTSKPANSANMTEAILNTIYANIVFKSLLTSGQAYVGLVQNFETQNRIKFYFDTIARSTNITNGEQIKSQFEFEIK